MDKDFPRPSSLATVCSVRMGQSPGWLLFQGLMATTLFYTAHWRTYVCDTLQVGLTSCRIISLDSSLVGSM